MKRTYKTPKAVHVDFNYEEKVTASSGDIALYGDGNNLNVCQQVSTTCWKWWTTDTSLCRQEASDWSLRP